MQLAEVVLESAGWARVFFATYPGNNNCSSQYKGWHLLFYVSSSFSQQVTLTFNVVSTRLIVSVLGAVENSFSEQEHR